jgi:adenosylhomocysteine nucleosidase
MKQSPMAWIMLAVAVFLVNTDGIATPQPLEGERTGILGAFSEEVDILEGMLTETKDHTILGMRFVTGKLNGRSIVLATTGVGKVNGAMVAALMIDHFKPSEVFFTGIAGAIDPELGPADLVLGEKTAQHDLGNLTPDGFELRGMRNPVDWERNPVYFEADPRLLELAAAAARSIEFPKMAAADGERIPKVVRGIIVTGDVFLSSPSKKEALRKTMNASAVDMEGAAVAQVCRQCGVPCLVIRGISDSAGSNARQQISQNLNSAVRNSARLVAEMAKKLAADKK